MNRALWLALTFLVVAAPVHAQLTPEQQAEMILNSARKAFNEKNYPFATTRFREYLSKFGGHKDNNSARFGLALAMIEGPEKDRNYPEIQQLLAPLAQDKNFPEQAMAAYQLALAFRTQGSIELAKAETTPNEAPQRREAAKNRFEAAANAFAQALPVVQAKAKGPGDKTLAPEWEWVARVRPGSRPARTLGSANSRKPRRPLSRS